MIDAFFNGDCFNLVKQQHLKNNKSGGQLQLLLLAERKHVGRRNGNSILPFQMTLAHGFFLQKMFLF